jgi:hypothetical protein
MKGTNFLATIFLWTQEVIEAAETPFSKLAIFVLPVMAPLVPAFMTMLHMFKLLQEMFTFAYAYEVSAVMAGIIGIVLELLGYVGAITFIRSLFRYVKNRQDEEILPVVLNFLAYFFYIVAMWLINYQLGKYFGTASIINTIFGLLSFITIPTGLLAANHLSERAQEEHDEKEKDKDRKFKLDKYKIKHGINPDAAPAKAEKPTREKRSKSASWYREKMLNYLSDTYRSEKRVATVIEIARKFKLDYDRSKGFISGLRTRWKKDNNVSE